MSHLGTPPHYISQALMPRVLGWWGRPHWMLGEACLNSNSSSACKLSLYLIPPTVISSLSLLPSPETCLHGGHRGRQLGVNLGNLSAHLTLFTPKQMLLEGSLQAIPQKPERAHPHTK